MKKATEIDIQQRYYSATAHEYNSMHVNQEDEHFFALSFLLDFSH